MSDEQKALINIPEGGSLCTYSDKELELAMASQFLPRLQLMTAASDICKEGKFPNNHYALVYSSGTMIDLGESTDALIVSVRPKAMDMSDGIVISYRPYLRNDDGSIKLDEDGNQIRNPVFSGICEKADMKAKGETGYMYGLEFLVWLGQQETFATLFFGTVSARREAGFVKSRIGGLVTFRSKMIDTGKYKYFSYSCIPCTTPPVNMPEQNQLAAELHKFNNPTEVVQEVVTSEEAAATSRER